ncbi:hypothetical protein N9R79_07085 [Vibrio sp.]|nr:hypothetical protein [Vibrio sp.]
MTQAQSVDVMLHRINRVRTIHGTFTIEGGELDEALPSLMPTIEQDLLKAHKTLMIVT